MSNLSLFEDMITVAPPTEGIKYAGSKLKLLPHILQLARKVNATTILDGFTGTTRVAQAFARTGYRVLANDVSVWSKVLATCYLRNPHPPGHYAQLIAHLNALPGKDGWFTQHYGGSPEQKQEYAAGGLKKPGKYIIRASWMLSARKLTPYPLPLWRKPSR